MNAGEVLTGKGLPNPQPYVTPLPPPHARNRSAAPVASAALTWPPLRALRSTWPLVATCCAVASFLRSPQEAIAAACPLVAACVAVFVIALTHDAEFAINDAEIAINDAEPAPGINPNPMHDAFARGPLSLGLL